VIIFSIDLSSPLSSIAIAHNGECVLAESFVGGQKSSSELFTALESRKEFVPEKIELWAVGLGPGSFTGVRVALAAIAGFNLPFDRPVIGYGSHDALLAGFVRMSENFTDQQVAVVTDARRNDAYVTTFSVTGKTSKKIHPTFLCPITSLDDKIPVECLILTYEADSFKERLVESASAPIKIWESALFPSAIEGAAIAEQILLTGDGGAESLQPLYLRETNYKEAPPARFKNL